MPEYIPLSWQPQVIADSGGKWSGNALRFGTKAECDANVTDLFRRWTLVTDKRSIESQDPVNAIWDITTGTLSMVAK